MKDDEQVLKVSSGDDDVTLAFPKTAKIKEVALELENYEFFHSPYAFDKPDQKFLGRRDVVDRLKMILTKSDTKSGAYLVTGFRGMGKTSIVRKAIAEIN